MHIPGFNLFRFDRNRNGGGVAIYCADSLPCCLLSCTRSSSGVESLWVSVRLGCFHPYLAVGCFYRPPGASSCSLNDVCDNIESMMLNKKFVVVCGDFNVNLLDLSKPLSKSFQQFITSHSLIQPINVPTRYNQSSTSLVDLLLITPDVSLNLVFLTILLLTTCLCFYALTLPLPLQPLNHPSSPIVLSRTFLIPVSHVIFCLSLGL